MPDQRAPAQPLPIIEGPAELKHLRRQEQRRVGHTPGDHHIGVGAQRLNNALHAQVGIRGNQPLVQRPHGLAVIQQLLGRQGVQHVVADHGHNLEAQAQLTRNTPYFSGRRQRVGRAHIGDHP